MTFFVVNVCVCFQLNSFCSIFRFKFFFGLNLISCFLDFLNFFSFSLSTSFLDFLQSYSQVFFLVNFVQFPPFPFTKFKYLQNQNKLYSFFSYMIHILSPNFKLIPFHKHIYFCYICYIIYTFGHTIVTSLILEIF